MGTYEIRDTIDAPADKVFAIFADLPNAANNIESILGIEFLSEQRSGLGTRWRETRKMFGKEATEEMWISGWRPGSGYTVSCVSCGCDYETDLSFTPNASGTEVVIRLSIKPRTFMARLLSPLGRLFAGTFKKCMLKDIDDLRRKLAQG
jgi:uncharacterized membrane protein